MLSRQRVRVQPLVRELRSHMPHSKVKKKKKRTENQDSERKNVILKLEEGPRIFFPWTEKGK